MGDAANDPVWESEAPIRIGGWASAAEPVPCESPVATIAAMTAADFLIALAERRPLAPVDRPADFASHSSPARAYLTASKRKEIKTHRR